MPQNKTQLKQSIGAQIKALRAAKELTQMDLAVKMGISPSHISLWETGLTMPDSKYLALLCETFGVEVKLISKN